MRIRIAQLVLVIGLATTPAAAGTISIVVSQRGELADGKLTVALMVTNDGDETAHSVTPNVAFGDVEVRGKTHEALGPKGKMEARLTLDVGELGEGRWPYRVMVDYADANGYPFQALHATSYMVGDPPPAKIAVPEISSEGIASSGDVRVVVKNLSDENRRFGLRVLVSEGFETPDAETHQLGSWGETSVTVRVTNRTALVGSIYPIFAVAEYDDGSVHHAVVASSTVRVVDSPTVLEQPRLPME